MKSKNALYQKITISLSLSTNTQNKFGSYTFLRGQKYINFEYTVEKMVEIPLRHFVPCGMVRRERSERAESPPESHENTPVAATPKVLSLPSQVFFLPPTVCIPKKCIFAADFFNP
ncbi:MAG: hypothetical protein II859_00940 [Bacteroidales bacterium]|nr:hypothetical protein [Bacteroidales bacterium]